MKPLLRNPLLAFLPVLFLIQAKPAPGADAPIAHQITLPAGQSWCSDAMINGLFNEVNLFRSGNAVAMLSMSVLGMKDAELRASQFATYMNTVSPGSPGFNPHEGWDTTAASLGYNVTGENLAYLSTDPRYVVNAIWQGPLHAAAMLDRTANVAGVSCVFLNGTAFWTYEPGICTAAGCTQTSPPPPAPNPTPAGDASLDGEELAFLTLINNYRTQNGLGTLAASAALQNAATWMSQDMAAKNYFSHTDSLGRTTGARLAAFSYQYSPWGENLAAGYSDAQNAFNQWVTACDPDATGACTYAHRRNMLGPGFAAIGIARAYGGNSAYGWYWTTDFGGYVEQGVPTATTPPPGSSSPPAIASFTAAPSTVSQGQAVTLSWNVTGAGTVTIDNGVGNVSTVTSKVVRPSQTTTYTLTATNSWGNSASRVTVTVAAVPDTQAPPAPVSGGGTCPPAATGAFTGCYYNNVTLSGEPVIVRTDAQINFDWGGNPPERSVSRSGYSVRWQGKFTFAQGTYTFSAVTSDGMRLLIDGRAVLDRWIDQAATSYSVQQTLGQGVHLITVEYYERTGWSAAHLTWRAAAAPAPQAPVILSFTASPSTIAPGQSAVLSWSVNGATGISIDNQAGSVAGMTSKTVSPGVTTAYTLTASNSAGSSTARATVTVSSVPGTQPPSEPPPAPGSTCTPATNAFTGCYYSNVTLSGTPGFVRTDPQVNFDWGGNPPDRSVPRGGFSVRWTGNFLFTQGTYTFTALTSDGMRLYIDGKLILDRWSDQPATIHTVQQALVEGVHLVTVEYYERTGWSTAHLSWRRN